MKKILLIGKTGQVGAEIVLQAEKMGFEVHAFGRDELDITDFDKAQKIIRKIHPDFIINTSAYHVVPDCEKYPDKAFEVNVIAEKNLAVLSKELGICLVYYSTDKVFDGKKKRPYTESDTPNPLQMYGLSKYAGEMVTLNHNPNSFVLRTGGVFGGIHGSNSKKGNFMLYILREAQTKKTLEISSEQITTIVSAKYLAYITLQLLKKKAQPGIYHAINDGICQWSEIAKQIVEFKGLSMKIIPVNRQGAYNGLINPVYTPLSNKKLRLLGITVPSLKDAVAEYISSLA
jgi:dTDP-4-dehydrorhamnose reductase